LFVDFLIRDDRTTIFAVFERATAFMHDENSDFDVTVVGAGLAGIAASIHLARAGMRVACIEPEPDNTDPVGESLDWSAPDLLRGLDLPMDRLLREGLATYKRHVILKLVSGAAQHYIPSDWLGRPPFNVELKTLHVDRNTLDRLAREMAVGYGVAFVGDRVVHVQHNGARVEALLTASGQSRSSPWFVDASGAASCLFARAFELQAVEVGPRKVALWDYFSVEESIEGTTLLADCEGPRYMEWIWQIPIHPTTISVGYVATGESIKEKRQRGLSTEDIYFQQLAQFTDLRRFRRGTQSKPKTTSYHCRIFKRFAGPNWLVIGEAAAMVDPMTSYGVTGALRHAAEASRIITRYRHRSSLPWVARATYVSRASEMAKFFNCGIEKVVYDWPVRTRIGALRAGDMYTIPAWSMNHLYSRIRPEGVVSSILFGLALRAFRTALAIYYWLCKHSRPPAPVCAT
jgi:menaquinone-9 beta-reductase